MTTTYCLTWIDATCHHDADQHPPHEYQAGGVGLLCQSMLPGRNGLPGMNKNAACTAENSGAGWLLSTARLLGW